MRYDTTLHGETFGAFSDQSRQVHSSARTHLGHVRMINEDRILHRPERGLWAIADGMGGYHDGDIAAELVAAGLTDLADGPAVITDTLILKALQTANTAILAHSSKISSVIGSTVVVLHFAGDAATIFWVGDSRAYLIRSATVEQITKDHSVVQELLSAGLITPQQALAHPKANIITRALGIDEAVQIDKIVLRTQPGDTLLLCSDGFSRALSPLQIRTECETKTADAMLRSALERDASDNVSFIVVRL